MVMKVVFSKFSMDKHDPEFLISDTMKVSKLENNHVVLIHDCSSESAKKKGCESCRVCRAVKLICDKCRGNSIRKAIKRLKNRCPVTGMILGLSSENDMRFCDQQLAPGAAILADQKGEIVYGWPSMYKLQGFKLNSRLHSYEKDTKSDGGFVEKEACSERIQISTNLANSSMNHDCKERSFVSQTSHVLHEQPEHSVGWPFIRPISSVTSQSKSKCSEARSTAVAQWVMNLPNRPSNLPNGQAGDSMLKEQRTERGNQTCENESASGSSYSDAGLTGKHNFSLSSVSFPAMDEPESKSGWPLHKFSNSVIPQAREMSVVQWAMNLPSRSTSFTTDTQGSSDYFTEDNSVERYVNYFNEFKLLFKIQSSGYRRFSYAELQCATSRFSSENLIGEGGCSSVYKGSLSNGKLVAVKILKSYKESRTDFSLEMDIISSLKHKNITPLVGVCIEDDCLISVYDFMPRGSLEEHLHGSRKKSVLSWEVRFKAAIAIAEALKYLHDECSRPVVHRDVKSSNILLSDDFHPQLSDFGLAVWGPTDAAYMVDMDVVGTFGYMAPEYFMHGRVSDKIDVFSFGVVLLELLSGRKPIDSKTVKGQESLVTWAKPLMNAGDLRALLDPKLGGNFNIAQMHKMVLAAALCISQSARIRPKMSQILKLLKGEMDAKQLIQMHINHLKESTSQDEDDELPPRLSPESHLDVSLLDAGDDDPRSPSTMKTRQRHSLADHLKKPDEEFSMVQYIKQRSAKFRHAKFVDLLSQAF